MDSKLSEKVIQRVIREAVRLNDINRRVEVEGLEYLANSSNGRIFLMQHNHHIDDSLVLGASMYDRGLTPPIMVIGNNLYIPITAGIWRSINAISLPRKGEGRIEAYQEVYDALQRGKDTWFASTRGLVKEGCNETRPANIRPFLTMRQNGNRTRYSCVQELLDEHPVVPVANNSARLKGERWRARRDAQGPDNNFDIKMLRAYFTDPSVETSVIIGEPITEADSEEDLAERVNAHIQGNLPLFPEDYEAYRLHRFEESERQELGQPWQSDNQRTISYRVFLNSLIENDGSDVYRSALKQRSVPVQNWLRRRNIPRKLDAELSAVQEAIESRRTA